MKRLILALVLAAGAGLAGCDEPRNDDSAEMAPPVIQEPVAPEIEAAPPPVATPSPTDTPRADAGTLPPVDQRTSEETVTPESETLFY